MPKTLSIFPLLALPFVSAFAEEQSNNPPSLMFDSFPFTVRKTQVFAAPGTPASKGA